MLWHGRMQLGAAGAAALPTAYGEYVADAPYPVSMPVAVNGSIDVRQLFDVMRSSYEGNARVPRMHAAASSAVCGAGTDEAAGAVAVPHAAARCRTLPHVDISRWCALLSLRALMLMRSNARKHTH